jgi:hypothetical protein
MHWAFNATNHISHSYIPGRPGKEKTALFAPLAVNKPALAKLRENVFQESRRNVLLLRDFRNTRQSIILTPCQSEKSAKSILTFQGNPHKYHL